MFRLPHCKHTRRRAIRLEMRAATICTDGSLVIDATGQVIKATPEQQRIASRGEGGQNPADTLKPNRINRISLTRSLRQQSPRMLHNDERIGRQRPYRGGHIMPPGRTAAVIALAN
jgi:hypothetical protein